MRTTAKVGLTALIAALLLSAALGTASARNLSSSSDQLRVTWSRLEFETGLGTVSCQVTLEGSFHSRTIPKVARLLMGAVTKVQVRKETCTNGEALVENAGLPLGHITFDSFSGTLPNINGLRLLITRFHFWISSLGVRCNYGTSTDNMTFSANLSAGVITTLTPVVGRNTANLEEGGGFCPSTASWVSGAGDGTVTALNSTARVTIRLI